MAQPTKTVRQAGGVGVYAGRICLVRSRSGKRWVAPKGGLGPGKTAGEIALQEAWEEAGLYGQLRPEPVGSYRYRKAGKRHVVALYVLEVTHIVAKWPERSWRRRRWLHPEKAVARLRQEGLRRVVESVLET